MKIIEINSKSYYAGLSWQTLSATENVKKRIKNFKKGFYCVRNLSGMINLGYAEETYGKYKKLPSLAASVANAKKEPWLGVFRISEDLYWCIAVRDNQAILPDGDIVGNKEDADKFFQETISIGEWDSIIENGDIDDIELILTGKPTYVLLVKKPINYLVIIGGLLLIILIFLYLKHSEKKKSKIFLPKIPINNKQIKHTPGYKLISKPSFIFNSCKNELSKLPQSYYGWEVSSLNCSINNITVIYKKQNFGNTFKTPKGIISPSGNIVTQTINTHFPISTNTRHLLSSQDIFKFVYGYMQEFNIHGTINSANRAGGVMVNINNVDLNLLPIFFNIPSFRIKTIQINGLPFNLKASVSAEVWHD